MAPSEALTLLDSIVQRVALSRPEHLRAMDACKVLAATIAKAKQHDSQPEPAPIPPDPDTYKPG